MNEQIKEMREAALGLARLLEQQETVVAARKAAGRGTKRAEALAAKLRGALQAADRQIAAVELAASNKKIAAYEARAVYLLSAGDISRKPAAELLVQNVSRKVGEIFEAGGSRDDARAAALKQFKETAGSLSDPWFREIAGRLEDLAGLGL